MTHFLLHEIVGAALNITILDVGAMVEGSPRYASLIDAYQTHIIGFEPDPEQYRKLCREASPTTRCYPLFLGPRAETATCHVTRYPGCSSLYEPNGEILNLFSTIGADEGGNFEVVNRIPVETHTLDEIPDLPPIHYMKLDVQGAELDILKAATKTLANILLIEVEVEFVPLYKDQPLFGDIQCYLRDQGFLLHKLVDVSGRCFRPLQNNQNPFLAMSQMLWADAIFVRDFTRLDRLSADQLLQLAVILHDLYYSYDFAYCLLQQYDDRQQTDYATTYLERLKQMPSLELFYLNQKLHP